MSLAPGTRIGPYEITAQIGVGGMGEVYRATDTDLKRQVAIKVLPESVAGDTERLARFQREAEVLAVLNHPNIAQIYGLARGEGRIGLVMELVEGPTLADRITQGAIPVDEALPIARQIAEALEAAHEQGIIHRDLKPANIKVRPDGTVKVLDFGLAKAMEPVGTAASSISASLSPTITTPAMTQMGMILGTAAYMSPEQARGKPVDKRTDIWAFGCVFYEMLAGRRAFEAEDVSETLAAVLRAEVDWSALPEVLSPALRLVLVRCLEKNLRQRLHDIADVRLAIEGAFEVTPAASAPPVPIRVQGLVLRFGGAVLIGGLIVGVAAWRMWPVARSEPIVRFPLGVLIAPDPAGFASIAISSGGEQIAYGSADGISVKETGEVDARLLAQTAGATQPVFSPNGQAIVFQRDGQLWRLSLNGGAQVRLVSLPQQGAYGVQWLGNDTILYAERGGDIRSVQVEGGTPEVVVAAVDNEQFDGPQLLPGGDRILFSVTTAVGGTRWDDARVVVQDLSTGERITLVEGGSDARYLPSGHLVYAFGTELFAARLDLDTLRLGDAQPVVSGMVRASFPNVNSASANYAVSQQGTLVYLTGTLDPPTTLVWVDSEGNEEALNAPPRVYTTPRVAPGAPGRIRVAAAVRNVDQGRGTENVMVWDEGVRNLRQLTFETGRNPLWTPDGEHVLFESDLGGGGLFSVPANGGMVRRLFDRALGFDWTPDGSGVIFYTVGATAVSSDSGNDIGVVDLTDPESAKLLISSSSDDKRPSLSPNGQWLAYDSNETGQYQVYLRPYPDIASRQELVSTDGGVEPRWSRDGRTLYYWEPTSLRLMAVPVETDGEFSYGAARQLFSISHYRLTPRNFGNYDIGPDGRFLFAKIDQDAVVEPRIVLVQNFLTELERLVPTN